MNPALRYAQKIAYSSKEVLNFTYEKSMEYANKPGVYCECGVAAGAQIIAMAAGAPNKLIYAFDSFQGIPLPSNMDNQMPGIRLLSEDERGALPNPGCQPLVSSGATSVSFEAFCDHLDRAGIPYDKIIPMKGWFETILPDVADEIEPISILRLDGDLYNSTYVCLKYLYPKVIEGGLVIIDDWALPGCSQAVFDYFAHNDRAFYLSDDVKVNFITNGDSQVAWWTK